MANYPKIKNLNILLVVASATIILTLSIGVRGSFGLFMPPVTDSLQISREIFSFAIAIQMLAWGIGQPFFGMLADLYGTRKIIVIGFRREV